VDHLASLEQQAIDFAKRGDFGPAARSVNEQLTSLSPSNQGAWTRLARCCLELGQQAARGSCGGGGAAPAREFDLACRG
jgi:hypothetical protein